MLQGTDGAYYGIINIAGDSDAQPSGNCPFRTNSPTNPQSYRGWDGEAFTVQWHSAYTTSTATASAVSPVSASEALLSFALPATSPGLLSASLVLGGASGGQVGCSSFFSTTNF